MVRRAPPPLRTKAEEFAKAIKERTGRSPKVALLLGTGHALISGRLNNKVVIQSSDLPEHLAISHNWTLVSGELEGVDVVISDAPLAPYEGYSPEEVTFPVRALRAMGARLLILTAAAASLSQQLEPGSVALVEDHINFSGIHPLQGPNDDELGPRFPDMSEPYPHHWRKLARGVARKLGSQCLPGVFAAVQGPSLPTRAEYRFLRRAGADLVGMSLVPEVLAAVHSGFEVLALVGITQYVRLENSMPLDIESMLDAADLAAPRMASLLAGVVATLAE